MKKLFLTFVLAASLMGCASVPLGDAKQDAALKTFAVPAAGKAGVYVYRNETMGAAIKMNVTIDGQVIGQTASKTFLYKEVTPGKHIVASLTENTETLEIDAKPGTLTYIWQEVKMGLFAAGSKLRLMSEVEGKKGVLETKLAETK